MTSRTARAEPSPVVCVSCRGFGCDLEHSPLRPCGSCAGTGRAAAPPVARGLLTPENQHV